MMRGCALAMGLAILAGPALAQTGAQTCAKMQAEDRLGPVSPTQCQCHYSVAEQVLDDDIRALLFDAWYNGNDNMAKMEQIKPQTRVRRQLKSMADALRKYCS